MQTGIQEVMPNCAVNDLNFNDYFYAKVYHCVGFSFLTVWSKIFVGPQPRNTICKNEIEIEITVLISILFYVYHFRRPL